MLRVGQQVRVLPSRPTATEWWGKVGSLFVVDPYTNDEDYYGVRFEGVREVQFFWSDELEDVKGSAPEIALIPGPPRRYNTGALYRPSQEPPIRPYQSPLEIQRELYAEPINQKPGTIKR